MTVSELRQKFLDFFEERGHAILPSSRIVPENDPSVLFTTAGMQPLVPYLMGQPHPMGNRLADCQKCLRTNDIDEVGDNRHLTFFEMLGNWSLGDYFKQEAIGWSFEFLTDPSRLAIDPKKIYVTVFEGDSDAPRDEESMSIWQAQFELKGMIADLGVAGRDEPTSSTEGYRIYAYGKKENWWPDPQAKGLCGPDTEVFFDTGKSHDPSYGPVCHPACDCGRFVEIWNNVFMQFNRREEDGNLEPLPNKNVDTGMGLERTAAVISGKSSVFDLAVFQNIIKGLTDLTGVQYGAFEMQDRSMRIIADHIRAAVFALSDGVEPANVQQGYVVRRLIRRSIREAHTLRIKEPFTEKLANIVIGEFGDHYTNLILGREKIIQMLVQEEQKFASTLEKGMKKLEEMLQHGPLSGEQAFVLYSTYGFPVELTEEILRERGATVDRETFQAEFLKHQEQSRTAAEGLFKGGLQDTSDECTRLHTATHLLHQALRHVLGSHVEQRGSNITRERLRLDFTHPNKLSDDEVKAIEDMVNEQIQRDLPVTCEEMNINEARNAGAIGLFEEKYGNRVTVYTVGDFSKEICGGPHVTHTGEIGAFKITKQEASSAGVRRLKAVVGEAARN